METVLGGLQERIDQLEAENRCSFHDNPAKSSHPLVHSCQSSSHLLLSSKPFFAGHLSLKSRALQSSASCSQLSPTPHAPPAPPAPHPPHHPPHHPPLERKVSRVEQLKEAFLLARSASTDSAPLTSFNRFQRSNSFGYDIALGFGGSSSRPILDVVDHQPSTTSSPLLHRRPPPVEAVVITRDSTPRSQTAEENVDGSIRPIQPMDSFDSPVEFDSVSTDFDEHHFLLDSLSSTSNSRNYALHLKSTPVTPDDVIEVDRPDRGSVDSESVSSFSIISEAVTASDRSFERCDSSTFFLTPRSATRNSQDTLSRKSFAKTLRKRKMFKVAANAMFSLCGP